MKTKYILTASLLGAATVNSATITWSTQANAAPALLTTVLEAQAFDDDGSATSGIWTSVAGNAAATTYANIHPTLNEGAAATSDNGIIPTSGDADLDAVLGEHAWTNADFATFTLTNLTAGDTYRIQFYFSDTRTVSGIDLRQLHFDDGNGNDSTIFTRGSGMSTYGTFVADGTGTQTINYTSDTPSGGVGLNGYVISTTPVPEPTSSALLGLGGLALILRRRK